jgi:hypothetical protein
VPVVVGVREEAVVVWANCAAAVAVADSLEKGGGVPGRKYPRKETLPVTTPKMTLAPTRIAHGDCHHFLGCCSVDIRSLQYSSMGFKELAT